jgi:hypothetical protein
MGNNQSNKLQNQLQKQRNMQQMTCPDDEMCKNIDSNRSTAYNIIYTCPEAKCVGGTCSCGAGCERDPYTGMCCSKVIREHGTTFCEENVWVKPCNVPNQVINGHEVKGKEICDIYNKYNKV